MHRRGRDTIGFVALARNGGAHGQMQYVATSVAGEEMSRWHGVVQCLVVDGNTATIGGSISTNEGSTTSGRFAIRVTDNVTPDEASDIILLNYGEETAGDCSDDFEDNEPLTLARGDVTVRDNS